MTLIKLKEFYDNHREQFDLVLGGGIGLGTSIEHYWKHFHEDELFKLIDGALGTGFNTIVGAVLLWAIHKYVLKSKKK